MSFYHRYELLKLISKGEPKTFQAREISSNRRVYLHLWSAGPEGRQSPLLLRLRDWLRQDPVGALGNVIELQEISDPVYVVTPVIEDFHGLEAWANRQIGGAAKVGSAVGTLPVAALPRVVEPEAPAAAPSASLPPSTPVPGPPAETAGPASAGDGPGEFTRLFLGTPPAAAPPPAMPASPPTLRSSPIPSATAKPPEPPPAAGPPGQAGAPGEFTRLFLGGTAAPPSASPAATPAPAAPSPLPPSSPFSAPAGRPQEPGEFTRIFLGGAPVAGQTPPPPAPSAEAPQLPVGPPTPAPAPPPSPLVAPPPQALQARKEVKVAPSHPVSAAPPPGRMGAPPAPGAESSSAPGEFTRFFGSPYSPSALPVEEIERGMASSPPPPPSERPFQGPSEFTIRFGKQAGQHVPPPQLRAPQAASDADATVLFRRPEAEYSLSPAEPAAPVGMSEFTRVVMGPGAGGGPGTAGSAASGSAPATPGAVPVPLPPRKNTLMPLLVGLMSVVVVILTIVLVVVLLK